MAYGTADFKWLKDVGKMSVNLTNCHMDYEMAKLILDIIHVCNSQEQKCPIGIRFEFNANRVIQAKHDIEDEERKEQIINNVTSKKKPEEPDLF